MAPVLANLYLTGFDTALEAEGFAHVRYADDFVVLAKDESAAQRGLRYVSTYLSTRLRLAIKPAKTQLARADDSFTFVGFRFTGTTWTVPAESIERFKEAVSALLERPRTIPEVSRSHNDLVRGWRHYYFGNSAEMDRQLAELDSWRTDQCRAYMLPGGHDSDAAVVWFERLIEHDDGSPPAGTYAPAVCGDEGPRDALTEQPDEWHEGARDAAASHRERRFSTVLQIHEGQIGRKQLPVLLDDGWLRVPTFGAFVTKSHALVVVRRKKQVIFECPFDDLSCLTVEANGVVFSTVVIDECARRGIPIAFCRVWHRLIFEFQRAYVFSVNRARDLETRLVAVHPVMGIVGTRTIHRFSTRFSALATRCVEHLAGAIDLYPQRECRMTPRHVQVPAGEANLSFGSGNAPRRSGSADAQQEPVAPAESGLE